MKKLFQSKDAPKTAEAEKPIVQPEEAGKVVFSATLTVGQILKQMVVLDVKPDGEAIAKMHAAKLSFDRSLLPGDYDFGEKREFSLVITRTK